MEAVFTLSHSASYSTITTTKMSPSELSPTEKVKSPLVLPVDRSSHRKRTLSGGAKSVLDLPATVAQNTTSKTLPPPPSRVRKIIQMKPKQLSDTLNEQSNDPRVISTSSKHSSASSSSSSATSATPKKGKQPSATSAAGRKIARKTAHSIIERRRRSKMNEEFGVLKEMIPACAGVEMHKLAILQAGIEYMKYLEGCIEGLKAQTAQPRAREDTDEELEDDYQSMEVDHNSEARSLREPFSRAASEISSLAEEKSVNQSSQNQSHIHNSRAASLATNTSNSAYTSPNLIPTSSSNSLSAYSISASHVSKSVINGTRQRYFAATQNTYSPSPPGTATTPLQSGISPAFTAFHFSPDLSRTSTQSSTYLGGSNCSPRILPLPQAALPPPLFVGSGGGDDHAEATATAALMMLTNDRRGSIGATRTIGVKGMSVKDLLAS